MESPNSHVFLEVESSASSSRSSGQPCRRNCTQTISKKTDCVLIYGSIWLVEKLVGQDWYCLTKLRESNGPLVSNRNREKKGHTIFKSRKEVGTLFKTYKKRTSWSYWNSGPHTYVAKVSGLWQIARDADWFRQKTNRVLCVMRQFASRMYTFRFCWQTVPISYSETSKHSSLSTFVVMMQHRLTHRSNIFTKSTWWFSRIVFYNF